MTGITAGILDYIMQVGKIMGIMTVGTLHRSFVVYEALNFRVCTVMAGGTGAVTVGWGSVYGFNKCQVAGAVKGRMTGCTARGFRNGMDIVKYMGIMTVGTLEGIRYAVVYVPYSCCIGAAVAGGAGAFSVARCIMHCFDADLWIGGIESIVAGSTAAGHGYIMDITKIMGIMAGGTVGTGISRPGKNAVINGGCYIRSCAEMTGIAGECT